MPKMLNISPLEGNPIIKFLAIVSILLALIAIKISGIVGILLWFVVFLFSFTLFSNLYIRLRNKWGWLHYPMMVRYAKSIGLTHAGKRLGMDTGNAMDFATMVMVQSVYPESTENEQKVILDEISKLRHKLYSEECIAELLRRYSIVTEEKRLEEARIISKALTEKKDKPNPQIAIAYLVGKKYGEEEQMKYFFAVLADKAK